MANNRCTYQQEHTISVKREKLIEVASNEDLSKKDLKVFLVLLTQLDGYIMPKTYNPNWKDPLNFKRIDIRQMSELLDISKKDVKKSIENLWDAGYLETGSNDTIKDGYRFTF